MLGENEFNHVFRLLSHALHGNFAFCVVEDPEWIYMPHKVFYSGDHGSWSCIVNLLQGVAAAGCNLDGITIYINGTTPYNNNAAAEGMCAFFNINVQRRTYTEPFSDAMLQNIYQYMDGVPYADFQRIDPSNLLYRDGLDGFLNLNLGQNPLVSLQSVHQTHLHRIYMALAFRRVQRKFQYNEQGLAIAAVLVNAADGRVRGIAHNTKNDNVTYHAEVNLVQAFIKNFSGEKDGQFIIYSTLQPCPMCASMIAENLPNATVFYGQTDPGSHMKRMKSRPRHFLPLHNISVNERINDGMQMQHKVKHLHGYSTDGQHGVLGGNVLLDIVDYLDTHQNAWRKKQEYSLTRNLYKNDMKHGINAASKTIDRKVQQYHHNHNQKPTVVPNNQFRSQRREAIQRVVEHIFPLLDNI